MAQVCETKSCQLMSMALPSKPLLARWSPNSTSSYQSWPQGLYQAVGRVSHTSALVSGLIIDAGRRVISSKGSPRPTGNDSAFPTEMEKGCIMSTFGPS